MAASDLISKRRCAPVCEPLETEGMTRLLGCRIDEPGSAPLIFNREQDTVHEYATSPFGYRRVIAVILYNQVFKLSPVLKQSCVSTTARSVQGLDSSDLSDHSYRWYSIIHLFWTNH